MVQICQYSVYTLFHLTWYSKTLVHLDFILCRAKQDKAVAKREIWKTGGGSAPPDLPEETHKVLDVISEEIDDIGCTFDSDVMPSTGKLSQAPLVNACSCTIHTEIIWFRYVAGVQKV